MPGIVLTSLSTGPFSVRKKSMRATPAPPSASNSASAACVSLARYSKTARRACSHVGHA
jgi:hypothetical protein